jgi:hypothetical protein
VDEEPAELPTHPLQLADVWIARFLAERRAARPDDPPEPSFAIPVVRRVRMLPEDGGFTFAVRVAVVVPVVQGDIWTATVDLRARVVVTGGHPISAAVAREFAKAQGAYLIWPFARSYLDQIARNMGIGAPLLPTLIVPR